jgi:di/tricarboxylate transporter
MHAITLQQGLLFSLIGTLFIFLIWGRYRYDLVAFGALLIAYLMGAVSVDEAFSGFGHPAVIIIALVLIISRGLYLSGAIEFMASALLDSTRSIGRHISVMAGVSAALSAIMNNVAALALLMPIDLQAADKAERSPRLTLMPLSFASILGGMITLIGTPPNIVIATFRQEALGEPYTMFDFAPVGLVVALVGIAYVALIGWRLIPHEGSNTQRPSAAEELERYLVELRVPTDAKVVNQRLRELDKEADECGVQVLGLIRGGNRYQAWRHMKCSWQRIVLWSRVALMPSIPLRVQWVSAMPTQTDPLKRYQARRSCAKSRCQKRLDW